MRKLNKDYTRTFGLICGKSDMGKSFLVETYIIPLFTAEKPVLILDTNANYEVPGLVRFANFQDFYKHQIVKKKKLENRPYLIPWMDDSDCINFINFALHFGRVALIFEEAHLMYIGKVHNKIEANLRKIVNVGRHYELDCIFVTQVPYQIDKSVRAQFQFITSFRQSEPSDIQYLAKKDHRASEIVPELEQYKFFTMGDKVPESLGELKIGEVNQL